MYGISIHTMGLLAEILSSNIRAEIFRNLFGIEKQSLHLREIERRTGFAVGTVQQEIKKLQRLDIITRIKDGNRINYKANTNHPLYPEIRNLVLKTSGLADVLKTALSTEAKIKIAFVFGSFARKEEKAASDVDLMVIGDIGLRKLFRTRKEIASYGSQRQFQADGQKIDLTISFITRNIIAC